MSDDEFQENEPSTSKENKAGGDGDFESAMKKAKNMAASIKQKGKSSKRKVSEKEDDDGEDDIVDKYGLDDYDDDESRKFNFFLV